MTDSYDDILHLPHHVSKRHPQMSLYNRAAQFAPFAALAGYGEAIAETARPTVPEVELEEDGRRLLDRRLIELATCLAGHPVVSITYFQPDARKAGGTYVVAKGVVKEIHDDGRMIQMEDGGLIRIDAIVALEGDVFLPDEG